MRTYQDIVYPEERFNLIKNTDCYTSIKNVLDIGCNKGYLTQMFAENNIFAVGIDLKNLWKDQNNGNAILGKFTITDATVNLLPNFDAICLLSVHHQIVREKGDEYTQTLIHNLYKKTNVCMYIEFSGVSKRYGYLENSKFIDNNETSLLSYFKEWLTSANIYNFEYIGKSAAHSTKKHIEPFRYMVMIRRK